ncbi:MAG: Major facilitator superfamily protein 10 Tetracycline transporter-like protein [Clostridiaceae bacterium]|jgi:DHA1 family tetracycline resistance protein-like MFS transporter|nr:Major facilitator superfamily protein 10 Tetracycline transporter-like protein [Clostridiaceae bacterium]
MKKEKNSIMPIFFTVFLDLLGLGIVIPILPAVLLDPIGGILPLNCSYTVRLLLYGFLIAAYPFSQFFGAPIIGTLADSHGRKNLLMLSLLGTLIGYIIFVTGIIIGNVYLLFWGRVIDGFTGGNISVAQSSISDISDEKTKARNFGLIGMAFGVGFVIGPFIGGKLSDPDIFQGFTYATPFFLSIFLTAINIILVYFNLHETLIKKRAVEVDIFTGFKNIRNAFSFKKLRVMFLVVFLLNIGHNFFTQFFQVFLMGKFGYTQSKVANFFAYMGLWIAVSQGGLMRPLSKKFSSSSILRVTMVSAAFIMPLLILPNNPMWLYFIIPFVAVMQGMNQPNTSAIISNLTDVDKQGEILGINQSMQSLAQSIPPIIAAFATSININLPIMFSAVSTLIAWIIFTLYFINAKE